MSLTKSAEAKIVTNEKQIQASIDAGGNERPWDGNLPEKLNDDGTVQFPARETSNINVIVPQDLMLKTQTNLTALSGTGRYITCEFYGMSLICDGAYMGKVSGEPEVQFTEKSVSKTNAHGTDEARAEFEKVFGKAKVHKTAPKVETPVEADPFA